MIVSLWRLAHLGLALVSAVFLLILSITGVILAIGAVNEKTQEYQLPHLNELALSQSIPKLWETYPEINTLTVDHNGFVSVEATDVEGNAVHAYIDPASGEILGEVKPQSAFIQWNIALHRSLFLKETGRIIVGVVSFLLLLITITGILLIIKRQQGIVHFFAKVNKDFFSQYYHVVTGRIFLIPVLLLALTGTYLFLVRIGLTEGKEEHILHEASADAPPKTLSEFPVFQKIRMDEVEKIEFPFIPGDPEEYYTIKLRDREITVNQVSGAILEETRYPYTLVLEKLSLDLHTGRTSVIWAIILGFASLNMLAFMYTGFAISLRRKQTKIRNKYTADSAEYILLAGTENGSTLAFAHQVHQQLLAQGHTSFLTEMNRFTHFPRARHFLIFTSTYGLGTAPANAGDFLQRLLKFPPAQPVKYNVIGFGSRAYPDFCAYARQVDEALAEIPRAQRLLNLHTVNDRSAEEFTEWLKSWNAATGISLPATAALYTAKVRGLKKFIVVEKTPISDENATFRLVVKPQGRQSFRSGDLLAIYPANDGRERLYSVAKVNGALQLIVKHYPDGLGSAFLYGLEPGATLSARLVCNKNFHFPNKAPAVVMIANGTGIAPFLGMMTGPHTYLYAGFRHDNVLVQQYRQFAEGRKAAGQLTDYQFAFSREGNPQYVMDLIRKDAAFLAAHLAGNGVVMICGALAMQRDVEAALQEICHTAEITYPKHQILSDCY